jgi:Flp pilus assembly pilin Flp
MKKEWREEFSVTGEQVMSKVKELLHEGNATKIIIKNESGHTIIEVPLVVGAVTVVLVPVLAAVGAVAALLAKCTIVVVREKDEPET